MSRKSDLMKMYRIAYVATDQVKGREICKNVEATIRKELVTADRTIKELHDWAKDWEENWRIPWEKSFQYFKV